jgi:hypothetical protein
MSKFSLICVLTIFLAGTVSGQMKRERSSAAQVSPEPFWATSIVTLPSVTAVPAGDLVFTIQHAFGPVSDGFKELFGLDRSANIRFGLDYGVSDRVSIGVGRSRYDKVYDVRTQIGLATWMRGSKATMLSVFGNIGVDSQDNGSEFGDRLSSYASVLVAHTVSDKFSIQVSPAWTHFNLTRENVVFGGGIEKEASDMVSLGLAGRYVVSTRASIMMEYIPVLGTRSDGTSDVFSVGVDLETGGHIFQLFVTSTQWIAPQYVVAKSRDNFFDGDFGFGFNVHRAF